MSGAKNSPTRLEPVVFRAVTKLRGEAVRTSDPLAADLTAILQHAMLAPRRRRGRALFGGAS